MAQNNNNDNVCDNIGKINIKTSLKALEDDAGNPKPLTSTIHQIGGLSWRAKLRKVVPTGDDGPPRLDLYVYCNEEVKDKLWLCKVRFSVCCGFANPLKQKYNCLHNFGPFYGFNTYYWVLTDIDDELQMQPEDMEPIVIKLEIKITHIHQKRFPLLDTTLAIKIGENRTESFSINKLLLAAFSNYFNNLFFGDWSDKKKADNYFEIIETNDFNVKAFGFMIYSLMTMGAMVHQSNFLEVYSATFSIKMAKLAIKYDMAILVDYCEKDLMDCKDSSKIDLLELADQYPELNNLKEHCLNGLSIEELMKDFAKTAAIHSRLSPNTQQRLNAIMAGKSEEMRNSLETIDNEIRAKKPKLSSIAEFDKMKKVMLGDE